MSPISAVLYVIAFAVVLIVLSVLAVYVRRREADMDYPEAHGSGLTEQERNTIVLGANSSFGGNISLS